jgi:hypothetical protein
MNDTPASSELHHKHIQLAHEQYFEDITRVWNAMQSRFQSIQTDYVRALEKACESQQPSDFTAAQDEYQRAFQAACNDASSAQGYAEAYRKYKTAIKNAMAASDVDQLSGGDINRLSQSLYAVSQTAMCLMPGAQAPLNNPFQAAAPA